MKASEYFEIWMNKGSLKQRKSLKNIEFVCNELEEVGVELIGSIVGQCCKKKFGTPSYGSIKNNSVLMEYIRLRGIGQKFKELDEVDIKYEGLILENKILRLWIYKAYI